jgi:hypothetical protein
MRIKKIVTVLVTTRPSATPHSIALDQAFDRALTYSRRSRGF